MTSHFLPVSSRALMIVQGQSSPQELQCGSDLGCKPPRNIHGEQCLWRARTSSSGDSRLPNGFTGMSFTVQTQGLSPTRMAGRQGLPPGGWVRHALVVAP